MRPKARLHATAVAAIVMFGEPKIDEPLTRAWTRTLRHNGITILDEYGREFRPIEEYDPSFPRRFQSEKELKDAHAALYAVTVGHGHEVNRFTEIFKKAPAWLLEFTSMWNDAAILGFCLPKTSGKLLWGERGVRDLFRWPLLPLGTMADGAPVPEIVLEPGIPPHEQEDERRRRRREAFTALRYGPKS